ncbi:MAG: hypothetical protein ABIT37_25695 [Luteolibacter sp.]
MGPFRTSIILAITSVLISHASASDARLTGFWIRATAGVPSARWTLSAGGTGVYEVDFAPPYPGFVLTSYFTWSTNAANNLFTYTVSRQTATGNGPYTYAENVSPPKTYSAPYTVTGSTNKIWAYETYTYAQAASVTEGNTITAGTLDTFFNKTGLIQLDDAAPMGATLGGEGMVIQPADGKILVASRVDNADDSTSFGLTRYEPGGALDKTFNATGTRFTNFGDTSDFAASLAVDPHDGKIVVVGKATNSVALARHTINGALDTSFNGTGKVLTDVAGGYLQVYDVAIHPSNGKIVVVGSEGNSLLVLRYLSNGDLDTTFNGTGRAVINEGIGNCVAIQPADGKIVVGGRSTALGYTIWRFNIDGTLDTTFNSAGVLPGAFGIP